MRKLLAMILAALLLCSCAAAQGEESLQLLAINVGKADCLLLQCGESLYMIDTGTEESWGAVSSVLKQQGITRLTGVIVTHTDGDHAGGAWALASSSIEVETWYASEYYNVKEKKHPVIKAAALRGEDVHWLKAGDELPMAGGSLTVLGPISHDEDKENNNSVVLLAQAGGGSILLAGDMEFPEENELLSAGVIPPCTVLKVGNHGEADATLPELVAAVQPRLAVISTNTAEEPDTPAKRVMELLKQSGAQIVQTQEAQAGILVTVQGGKATANRLSNGELPPVSDTVYVSDKSVAQDAVCLRNGGTAAVDVSGWYILSERGGETFVFPEGTVMEAGAEITVTSLSSESPGTFVWQDTKVWHKTKDDKALLYDVYGRLVSELE